MIYRNKKQEKDIEVSISSVADHGNDPYFINKARKSKAFLDKHGFPKEMLQERKTRMGL